MVKEAMKRSGKWYRKNEADIMTMLGLKPTPNSGSGWIAKEDGENENILCQLKSTDASSIRINKLDIDKLNHNARVSHKLPVFAVQFIHSGEVYLVVKPDYIKVLTKYLDCGIIDSSREEIEIEEREKKETRKIKSNAEARMRYSSEYEERFAKKGKSAT